MIIVHRAFGRTASARRILGSAATALAAIAALSPLPAAARDFKVGAIAIGHPWSRATPPGATTGAGYFALFNNGPEADRLVKVSSPVAPMAAVHRMAVRDGVMTMKPVEGGIEVPAGGRLALEPGGDHLMLMGLAKPFVEGETVPVTLFFEKAGAVEVQLQVSKMGASAPADDAGGETTAPMQ